MLQRRGSDRVEVEEAREKLANGLLENERAEVAPGIFVTNWSVQNIGPDMSKSSSMNLLVPAVIAYEFLALHVGNAIYEDEAALSELRTVFLNRSGGSQAVSIERLHAVDVGPSPFHGIAFEGNDPYAKVQIRLLGKLAFRVHFHHLSVSGPRLQYTHDLESGEEYLRKQEEPGNDSAI